MTKQEYYAAIAPLILFPVGMMLGAALVLLLWVANALIVLLIVVAVTSVTNFRWFLRFEWPAERAFSFGLLAGMIGAGSFILGGWIGLLCFVLIVVSLRVAAVAAGRGLTFAFQQGLKAWRDRKGRFR